MNISKYLSKKLLTIVLILALFFSFVAIISLRANNIQMLKLKEAVIAADQQGSDIEKPLLELRNYVFSHMNTQMRDQNSSEPPIQLVNKFNTYLKEQQEELAQQGRPNVYAEAQAQCEKPNFSIIQRANCIQTYVVENSPPQIEIKLPPKELYTFDFASPNWSPDLAGISLVIAIILWVALLIIIITKLFFRLKNK